MAIQRHFTGMVDIPFNTELTPWQAEFMRATKSNIDLLAGFNTADHTAIVKGDVEVDQVEEDTSIGSAFDSTDYLATVNQLKTTTRALNRLISEIG